MFLTKNNFLKSFSKEVHCSLINDRFVLPSNKIALVRVGNSINYFNISNVIVQEIHLDHYNLSRLNFLHHKEIIDGLNTSRYLDEFNNFNDINGNFFVLPNDELDSNKDLINKLIDSKSNLIDDFLKLRKFFNFLIFFIIVFFTIIIVIFTFMCLKIYNICKKQHCNTPEILPLEELASLFVPRLS